MDTFEKDWKLFRSKIKSWQEDYMERLIHEYIELLNQPKSSAERFWELEKRIKQDKKKTGVLCEMRCSTMIYSIASLVFEGAITLDDLSDFSEDLQNDVKSLLKN